MTLLRPLASAGIHLGSPGKPGQCPRAPPALPHPRHSPGTSGFRPVSHSLIPCSTSITDVLASPRGLGCRAHGPQAPEDM